METERSKVSEAFDLLQEALKEEWERFSDPAVAELARMLGDERLRLVKWMLNEVQKLVRIWQEGKPPISRKPQGERRVGKRRVGKRLPRGKSQPLSFYRPLILKALAEMGGQGRAKEVLERVFEMAKPHLSPEDLEFLTIGNDFRWRKKANWERYRMTHDGLLRPDSPQGIWELTERGWGEAKKLGY